MVERWGVFELELTGPEDGNPFLGGDAQHHVVAGGIAVTNYFDVLEVMREILRHLITFLLLGQLCLGQSGESHKG